MADRYWVGGTAIWDNIAGTKWAATSGGAGGESVPTINDNVFFNEASSGTVTVQTVNSGGLRYAQNLSFSGFTGTFASNFGAGLLVSGSLTLSTGMSFTYARNLYLAGSGTFTTAGNNIQGFTYVSGSGAIVSLGDAYNSTSTSANLYILEGGSFDTSGFAATFGTISGASGSLNLNSSTITLQKNGYNDPQALMLASGFNLNAGTSQIILTNDETRLNCSGGFNFYNVTFTASGSNIQRHLIEGPNTFNDLTFYAYNAAPGSARFASLYLNDNTTVSGTLTCSGGSRIQRTFLSYGTSGTLSQFANPGSGIVVTVSSLNAPNCDFRDITLAGGASGASPSGAGDCGGNTGIVFPSPKTVYSVGSTTSFPGTGWATTSGGAGSLDNFPLAQDTAIINDDSTASSFYIFYPYNFGTLDFTNRTNALTYTNAGPINYHGSFKLSAAVTLDGSTAARFTGRGTTDFIAAGNAIPFATWVAMPGGTFNFNDDFTAKQALTVFEGTLNTQNYTFSGSGGSSINLGVGVNDNSNATQTLNLGSSAIYTQDLRISGSGATVNAGTSSLYCTGQFGSVVTQYNSVTLNDVYFTFVPASASATYHYFQSSGSVTVNNVSGVAEQSGVTAYYFQCVSGFTVNNTLTITGLSTTQRAHLIGVVGSNGNLTISSAVWSNVDFQDITLQGGASGASPSGAGDCGGNSGIVFPAPKTIYRVGTETDWAGNNSWATTSSGAGSDNNFPLPQDTAVIDDNTALTGTLSYSTYPTYNHGTLDCTGRTTALTLNHGGTVTRFGSYLLSTGITVTGASQHRFYGSGATLLTAGNSITWYLSMGRADSSLQLQDAYSSTSLIQVQLGTFDANNYNVTIVQFSTNSSNGTERTVLMGSGLWTLTSTYSPWQTSNTSGFTLDKGTADILLLTTGNNTTKTFQNRNGPVISFNKLIIGNETATGTNTILYGKLAFTAIETTKTVSHDIYLSEDTYLDYSSDITIDTWSVSGTSGNPVSVIGITGQSVSFTGYPSGQRTNFKLTNVTSGIDYLIVKDIGELNGFKFAVGENSTDSGNNFNVYFTAAPPAPTTSNMFLLFR